MSDRTKRCPACEETKPLTEYWKRAERDALGNRYPESWCKQCKREQIAGLRRPEMRRKLRPDNVPDGMKWCPACEDVLPPERFGARASTRDGLATYCRQCGAARTRAYLEGLTEEERAFRRKVKTAKARQRGERRRGLLATYGLTPEAYGEMLAAQGGVCAVCRQPETASRNGKVLGLAVDHDRSCCARSGSCGKCVRALLCGNCNKGIGNFKDNPALLIAAVAYIQMYRAA